MDTRIKLAIGAGILVIVVAAALTLIFAPRKSAPVPDVLTSPSASATPQFSPPPDFVYEENYEAAEALYPVTAHVPKVTPYWTVELLGGSENGKLPLTVTVYVRPDQDEQTVIAQQRQYVEAWLTSIGQRPDTYALKIQTERPHTY